MPIKPFVGKIPIKTETSSKVPDITQFYDFSGVKYQGFFKKQLTPNTYFLQPQEPYQFRVQTLGDGVNNKTITPTGRGIFTGRNLFLTNIWVVGINAIASNEERGSFSQTSTSQVLFQIQLINGQQYNLPLYPPVKFFNSWNIDFGILTSGVVPIFMLFGWTEPV